MESNLVELIQMLQIADKQYYENDNPDLFDAEYDSLCEQYFRYTGKEWNSNKVPGAISNGFKTIKHDQQAKSLDKCNNISDAVQRASSLLPVIVEYKYDGLTLVIYPQGVVATRGNGEEGEDVTHTCKSLIRNPYHLPIRGEAFITKEQFERINKERVMRGEEPYKNLRNACAGMIRTLDKGEVQGITFKAYNILQTSMSETEQLQTLQDLGYDVAEHQVCNNIKEVSESINKITPEVREGLNFEIDGLVIKSNIPNAIGIFGETRHHYKNAFAYKFPSLGTWTTLNKVVWTVGRTGKVVPNAFVSPVNLLNTTVSKASLHNASILKSLNLSVGCEVFIVKNNDIIPGVVQSRGYNPELAIKEITHCPKCKKELIKQYSEEHEGVYQLYCLNPNCPSKTINRVVHMSKKELLDIDGLSIETATKMYEDNLIDSPEDIFGLSIEDIESLDGFAEPSAKKLYNSIQTARNTTLAKFIASCGIPLVNIGKAEDIAKHYDSYESLIKDIENQGSILKNIEGVGSKIRNSITEYKFNLVSLSKWVTVSTGQATKKVDKQLTFVITGTLEHSREHYEKLIKDAGHKVTGSVSKKTDYVLVGDKAGSKLDKATELGIPILMYGEGLERLL